MPILFFLATVLGGAAFWFFRARNAADAAREVGALGRDAVGYARQWNFKRRTDVHPVDSIDDAMVAKAALATALVELGDLPTAEDRDALLRAVQSRLDVPLSEAEELTALGHWLGQRCGGPAPAVPRLARRLAKLEGPAAVEDVAALAEIALVGEPNEAQAEALADMARRLGR